MYLADCSHTQHNVWCMGVQAISAWRDNSGFGRAQLVKQYFLSVEGASASLPLALTHCCWHRAENCMQDWLKALLQLQAPELAWRVIHQHG